MDSRDPLPTEEQRRQLGELMQEAFVELRQISGEQAHDLANAFHNLPVEIHGWGTWSVAGTRARFRYYQGKHKANLGVDYVALFDAIFPESSPQPRDSAAPDAGSRDAAPEPTVWVFTGPQGHFPEGIFSSPERAETWIAAHQLTGTLTAHPLDRGIIDWVRERRWTNLRPQGLARKRQEPESIVSSSTASQEHYHYEEGRRV